MRQLFTLMLMLIFSSVFADNRWLHFATGVDGNKALVDTKTGEATEDGYLVWVKHTKARCSTRDSTRNCYSVSRLELDCVANRVIEHDRIIYRNKGNMIVSSEKDLHEELVVVPESILDSLVIDSCAAFNKNTK